MLPPLLRRITIKGISVIGGGSWGTTLAHHLATKGFKITLWVKEVEVCTSINTNHENPLYLPNATLSENIIATNDIKDAIEKKELIIWVVPAQFFRSVLKKALPFIKSSQIHLSATKGIENSSLFTMSKLLKSLLLPECHAKIGVLSGPSFAKEVYQKRFTAVTLAFEDTKIAKEIQKILSTPYFRVYTHKDLIGIEIGGALKNVIAIAVGIQEKISPGLNTRAALITRGLNEISRLGKAMGGDALTFLGLAGLGDLILTCTGTLSRNRQVGLLLGEGKKIEDIQKDMNMVAEGIATSLSVHKLSKKYNVPMPISEAVYQIIHKKKDIEPILSNLIKRKLKSEFQF
ncbi:MAG: glycerol-3-phosphate dehydrogenase [Deltaproteobacteria bacterium]|nr:NAD(P)-dependent glycerol-3-phosphate dehydrogenase [Deltaproteobacteria bacterium]RLA88169.1 MAG: glycerol-3-phosphate dehydrogenase [Deltaproteobacteria bacterium]